MAADGWSSITTDGWTVHRVEGLGYVDYSNDDMIFSLSLTRSLPPPSLSLSLPPPLVSDEWSSISFSHSTHDALSSSVSLFTLSFLCKDVETDSHSVHPPVNPSVCQMNIYYSSTFSPLINPALHCVYFLCVYLLKYAFSVPSCFNVFVCICLCQITICPPTSHPPSLHVFVVWIKVSEDLLADTHHPNYTPMPLSHRHSQRVCVVPIQPSTLYVPAMPASAQFTPAQLGSTD